MELFVIALLIWAVKKLPKLAEMRMKQMNYPPQPQSVQPSAPIQSPWSLPKPPARESLPAMDKAPRVFESMEGIDPCHDDYTPAADRVAFQPDLQAYDAYSQTDHAQSVPSLFTGEDLVKAVVMSEILARPKYPRRRL